MRSVLIVEDEPGLLRTLRRYLTSRGYAVRTATSGPEALQQLQDHPTHLVLLDQNLPGKTGLEIVHCLDQAASNVRVVLMSALIDDALSGAARLLGVKACLQKPFSLCALANLLEREAADGVGSPS